MELKNTYGSIEELRQSVKESNEPWVINVYAEDLVDLYKFGKSDKLVEVYYYKITGDDTLQKIETMEMIKEISKDLSKYVNTEMLLIETFRKVHPKEIADLYERVVKKKGRVKSGPGCYSLSIAGKVGKPFELCLVND